MTRLKAIALGAALALSAFAVSGVIGSVEAAPLASSGIAVLPDLVARDSLVEEARHRHRHGPIMHRHTHRFTQHRHTYRPQTHGPRLRYRTDRHRHHYNGFWYAFPFWLYSTPAPYYGYSNNHVRWCLNRYRSYNPRTDMFLGYDGRYHRCRSPYRP
jgi:hypothetical protein